MSFEVDQLIADCRVALTETGAESAIRQLVERAVSEPAAITKALGEPRRGAIQTLHRSSTLTVLNVIWAPHMTIMPHDHRMWAVIGVYGGREDNIFWRRLPDEDGRIEAAGARSLSSKDATGLGRDIVHSVVNPTARFTGALHVYGGDFFQVPRSEWDPETLLEQPYSVDKALRLFEEGNGYATGDSSSSASKQARPFTQRSS